MLLFHLLNGKDTMLVIPTPEHYLPLLYMLAPKGKMTALFFLMIKRWVDHLP